jgi:hypothetical protein
MTISTALIAAGTAVTNPAPNTLGVVIPGNFGGGFGYKPSQPWTDQGAKALFPYGIKGIDGETPIEVSFVPSDPNATYTVTMWKWNRIAQTWVEPKDSASFDLTGAVSTYIENPGQDPIFLELSSISNGTVAIHFDSRYARAE